MGIIRLMFQISLYPYDSLCEESPIFLETLSVPYCVLTVWV